MVVEAEVRTHLPQAYRAQDERLSVSFSQVGRTVHQAFIHLTVLQKKDMRYLMAGGLGTKVVRSELDLPSWLGIILNELSKNQNLVTLLQYQSLDGAVRSSGCRSWI